MVKIERSAARAKNGGSSCGSGSGNSGSGSGGGREDDDDDAEDEDEDRSGHGGGPRAAASAGAGGGFAGPGANAVRLLGGDGIHVRYADGRTERIRAGIFGALDRRGKVTLRRRATGQEERRLRSLETVIAERGRAEITEFRGWRESVSRGRDTLSDPDGRTVMRRGLTAADIDRPRRFLYLD